MVRWAFTIDVKRCIGCFGCVIACKAENGTPRNIHWMRVLEKEEGDGRFAHRTFTPTRCNHCGNPPCVAACPTGAFVQRTDGIVWVNQDVCIGSMACLTACPYYVPYRWDGGDGYFGEELTPYEEVKYGHFKLGTAQKCHFCYHRLDEGRPPACVETCPASALDYGDIEDTESHLHEMLRQRNHFRPREELGTDPGLYYLT